MNLKCPSCAAEVTEVSYSKKFIFVHGVRHDAGWTWDFACCGVQVLDHTITFAADLVDEYYHSSLTDANGNEILSWLDGVEANQDGR